MAGQVVKMNHILEKKFSKIFAKTNRIHLHHADSFIKWAISVVGGVAVLLQEVVLDEPGDFERNFVVFGEGALSNELHNFLKILLLLKNFFEFGAKGLELGKVGIVVLFKGALVL